MIKWSNYQNNIFDFVLNSKKSLIVEALAGSAKTSTIIEAAKKISSSQSTLLVAFNKKIADELKLRSPEHVSVATLHSVGFNSIKKYNSSVILNQYKINDILKNIFPKDTPLRWEIIGSISSAVSMAKNRLISSFDDITNLVLDFDLYPGFEDISFDQFINHILFTLDSSKKIHHQIDFDDMIYFPCVFKINTPQFDNVFLDEAQDLNPAQIKFFTKLVKPNGRAFIFGDRNQAIYLFSGADSQSLDKLSTAFQASTLELPICYRCPSKVVQEAQRLVPRIEPYALAKEGEVEFAPSITKIIDKIQGGDAVLSRTNAPLISLGFKFIAIKKPVYILGKNFGDNIKNIILASKAKTIKQLSKYINKFFEKENKKLSEKIKDDTRLTSKLEVLNDKRKCIEILMEHAKTIDDVINNIKSLFEDVPDQNKICLSNTHQSKGLEYDNVYLLRDTFYIKKTTEEKNLLYVAITRSKNKLIFTNSK
jgi:superfamily I DNA/RNA helicase